jgi:geranylgeranyl diphosphate synthase, type II
LRKRELKNLRRKNCHPDDEILRPFGAQNDVTNIQSYFNKQSQKIDKALRLYLPSEKEYPPRLHQAMRYAVFSGGKRIRPILALAACEAVGGDEKKVLPAACALELIHCYSLVHDDLPSMDNDDLRRGKPTCHKKFGEDLAVLTGDALLTLAFKVLAESGKNSKESLKVIATVAEAVGSRGMVGGQAAELAFQKKDMDLAAIEYINTHKTGALIAVSLRVGAMLGGASKRQTTALYSYGKSLGLLFQIVDDILDEEGYASAVGVSEAKRQAQHWLQNALKKLRIFGKSSDSLIHIAHFVAHRKF